MGRKKLKIVKVPSTDSPKYRPQSFEKMPRMYLELLENKNKIKQNLVNKEYSPDPIINDNESFKGSNYSNKSSNKSQTSFDFDSVNDDLDSSDDDIDNDDNEDDEVSSKLKELLRDDISEENYKSKSKSPPTLAQLKERGQYRDADKYIPNIEENDNDDEEDKKRELLFKFQLLKKSYKDADIPEFSIHSDYEQMHRTYENTVRRLSLDSTVDSYKTYLIGGFMLVEFILGSWLKFDMEGFTHQQIKNMNSYDRLLIELGEKSYVPEGSDWPVELRLLFLIIINAGFFCVSKMLMKKTGSNILNMINSMNTSNTSNTSFQRKRRMKEPSIDLNNIPDVKEFDR